MGKYHTVAAALFVALALSIAAYASPFASSLIGSTTTTISLWEVRTETGGSAGVATSKSTDASLLANCAERKQYFDAARGAGGLALFFAAVAFVLAVARIFVASMQEPGTWPRWVMLIFAVIGCVWALIFLGLLGSIWTHSFCSSGAFQDLYGYSIAAAMPLAVVAFVASVLAILLECILSPWKSAEEEEAAAAAAAAKNAAEAGKEPTR